MFKSFTQALIAFGPLGVFALAVIDSTGIPVAQGVDALLIFLAVESPRNAWISALLAVLGSTIGTMILFYAARKGGQRFLDKATASARAQRFRSWFVRYGLVTVFVPAFIPFPMPLKLFVISAGVLGTRPAAFLAVILLARVLRYGGEVWLGLTLGHSSLGFLKAHVWHFALAGVVLFTALYLLVRLSDSSRRAVESPTGFPPERPKT